MKKHLPLLVIALAAAVSGEAQSPRMVLFEEFTGENCGPCAASNPGINSTLGLPINQQRVAAIKWQVPIPSAPSATWSLYKTNKAEIDWRFRGWNGNTSSSIINPPTANGYGYPSAWTSSDPLTSGVNSAPQGRLDGKFLWSYGASSNHGANLSTALINNAAAIPSPFTINMSRSWNNDATSITVNVTVTASQNFTANGALVFRTVMVERVIEFPSAPGSNGEKTFHDAAIKSFPNIQSGTSLPSSWTTGQTYTFSLACPLPSYVRKKTEVAFVGFVQDDGDRQVHQAYRLDKEGFPYDASALVPQVQPVCSGVLNAMVTIQNKGVNPITNMTITPYADGTAANVTTWSGNLLPDSTISVAMDPLNVTLPSGPHSFSYAVTGLNGTDIEVSNNGNATTFLVASGFSGNPVVEGFAGTFPPAQWTLIDPNSQHSFTVATNAGGYGLSNESMMLSWYTNASMGEVEEMILPPVDLQGNSVPLLEFLYAYAKKTNTSNDRLEILASTDCGANWTSLFDRSGDILKSVQDPVITSFVPAADQWRMESISLNNFNSSTVLIKFRATSGGGNNLYIDDINLRQEAPVGLAESAALNGAVTVFPNPATDKIAVGFTASKASAAVVEVRNALGQVIAVQNTSAKTGRNLVQVDLASHAAGIYYVTVKSEEINVTRKITLTH